ncbi:MAG: thiol-disulfide isomerase [Verrucomicrobiales bacterium]|nr:thiol-disulfide isomerase [Verrucomicrobiales bacterium]
MNPFRPTFRLLSVLLCGCLLASAVRAAEPTEEPIPKRNETREGEVINFSLLDYKGKHYELRRTDAKAVVLFFTSFGCPSARQSLSKLRSLRSQFATNGVVFWMVNSATQEDPSNELIQMLARSRKKELVPDSALDDPEALKLEVLKSVAGSLPVLRDEKQIVARRLGVTQVGEVVAIDLGTMSIVYRGAIDDLGADAEPKAKAKEKYLAKALNEFLSGKTVTIGSKPVSSGCELKYINDQSKEPVSYASDVAPLFQKHCVACHSSGNIGPFAMTGYKKVKNWSSMIEEVLLDRRMPPWHADPHYGKFQNDRALTTAETHTLLRWIGQGCPRGEGEDPLATAAPAAAVWKLGKPDLVVGLPKPQSIPATGTLNYRYINSDFEMPQDAWIRAAVCRADNSKVVHHIIVRVKYPDDYADAPHEAYLFTSWVPGLAQGEFPAGTGMFLPKGARFNFELHYTTTGQAQTDQSELGLYFSKEPPKRRLEVRASETRDFDIPPGEPDSQHFSHYCFKRDTIIYDLSPHMHLRGSWFKFELLYPTGKRETVLSVPQYDFNWQTSYRLAEPKKVPAGTWMLCTGGHDNSKKNPNNPDPAKRIKWGLQSWDEMFMGFMTVADAEPESAGKQHSKAN